MKASCIKIVTSMDITFVDFTSIATLIRFHDNNTAVHWLNCHADRCRGRYRPGKRSRCRYPRTGIKMRGCFIKAGWSKVVHCVSIWTATQHIAAPIGTNNTHPNNPSQFCCQVHHVVFWIDWNFRGWPCSLFSPTLLTVLNEKQYAAANHPVSHLCQLIIRC